MSAKEAISTSRYLYQHTKLGEGPRAFVPANRIEAINKPKAVRSNAPVRFQVEIIFEGFRGYWRKSGKAEITFTKYE